MNQGFKSKVWKHFKPITADKKVTCRYCGSSLSVLNRSTCSLIRHLKTKHPELMGLSKNEKLSNRAPPLRVPSPTSSDTADSIAAASITSAFEKTTTSTPGPSQSKVLKPPAFKKIKLTQDVPFTEGYLEDVAPFELKTSQIRKSPPRPNPRVYQEETGNHICSSCPCIAAQETEYDKMGKAWASELKLMTTEQQIFAKRAIAEIIFEGQLGSLSRNSVHIRQQNPMNEGDPFVIENTEYLYEKSESQTVVT